MSWPEIALNDPPECGLTLERGPNGGWVVREGSGLDGFGIAGAYSSTGDLVTALAEIFPDEEQEVAR